MTNIKNIDVYNFNMRKSIQDKIFFSDKVDDNIDTIFDYGCADGSVLGFLREMFPSFNLVGYDNNPDMIDIAKKNNPKVEFYSEESAAIASIIPQSTCLNLSSILHEIHTYCQNEGEIYSRINAIGFRYIAIRDMCLSKSNFKSSDISDVIRIRSNYDSKKISQFEDIFGSIDIQFNLLHFLLKYRYVENWEREVEENYVGYLSHEIYNIFKENYEIEYVDHYTLPFLSQCVKRDFGISLKDKTHIKVLLKRKN